MNKLDLHGVRHQEVDRLVENFILMNQGELPLTIVCGNSGKMIDLVNAVIRRINVKSTMLRYGTIQITDL
jgi:hypothetical protein